MDSSTDSEFGDVFSSPKKKISVTKLQQYRNQLHQLSQNYKKMINSADEADVWANDMKMEESNNARNKSIQIEEEFMNLLNSQATFQLSKNHEQLESIWCSPKYYLKSSKRNLEEEAEMQMLFHDLNPAVISWVESIVNEKFPKYRGAQATNDDEVIEFDNTLMNALRDGKVLCKLAEKLFPQSSKCQLLDLGSEFVVHRIIFFLETCRTNGLKPSFIFSLENHFFSCRTLNRKAGTSVLRSLYAVEKCARMKGFNGPTIDSFRTDSNNDQLAETDIGIGSIASSRESTIQDQSHISISYPNKKPSEASLSGFMSNNEENALVLKRIMNDKSKDDSSIVSKQNMSQPSSSDSLRVFAMKNRLRSQSNDPRLSSTVSKDDVIFMLTKHLHEYILSTYNKFVVQESKHIERLDEITKLSKTIMHQCNIDADFVKNIVKSKMPFEEVKSTYSIFANTTSDKMMDLQENLSSRSQDCLNIYEEVNELLRSHQRLLTVVKNLPCMTNLSKLNINDGHEIESNIFVILNTIKSFSKAISDFIIQTFGNYTKYSVITLGLKNSNASSIEPIPIIIEKVCNETRINTEADVSRSDIVREIMRLNNIINPNLAKTKKRSGSPLDKLKVATSDIYRQPLIRIDEYVTLMDKMKTVLDDNVDRLTSSAANKNERDNETSSNVSDDSAVDIMTVQKAWMVEMERLRMLKNRINIVMSSLTQECNV